MAELLETGRPIRNRELVIERQMEAVSPFSPISTRCAMKPADSSAG